MSRDIDQVRQSYRRFADHECRGYSDLYFTLAHTVADDEELVAFLAPLPVIQPNLFLASIQYLTGPERMPKSAGELRAFVRARGAEIAEWMRSRRTQANEVGRCAVLLPALPPGPLAILEVGASAGLCLLLDEFFYDYGDRQLGADSSRVRLSCRVTGSPPLPATLPEIAWRAGLDLAPIDVHDEADVRWLSSCVFADHAERRERLLAAVELCRARGVTVQRGNLVSDLAPLLDSVPRDLSLVVFHSAVLSYLRSEERSLFVQVLVDASHAREIVWISNEGRTVVPEITALAPAGAPRPFLLGRTAFHRGWRSDKLLALAHPHGAELEWLR
jgi:hypothetical protein